MRDKLPPDTGSRQISFICERQHYLSLSPEVLATSWRRCVKSCQSFLDGGGTTSGPQEGADQRVLPTEPDWPGRAEGTGRSLIPSGASHVGRGSAPQKGHSLAPQCTAGRVTRSGGSRLGRYGLTSRSSRSSSFRVVRIPGRRSLRSPCEPPRASPS